MRKWIWLFEAISGALPSWWSAITIIAAVLVAYLSVNQAMNILISIFILVLVVCSVVVAVSQIVYGILSAKYKHDAIESISKFIDEGSDLRLRSRRSLSTFDIATIKDLEQQVDDWERRSKKEIADYDPGLVSLLNVSELRGNQLNWIDARVKKLEDLLSRL